MNYHEISKQLGVSSIPLREACLRLHHEGFVEMAHSRWTRVVPLDVGRAAEACLALEALEALALELAAPLLQPKDIRQLRVLNETLRGALEGGETLEASLADEAFHHVWVGQARNREVTTLLAHLKARLRIAEQALFATEVQPPASPDEHDALIDVLAQRKVAEAARLLHDHWYRRFDRLRGVEQSRHGEQMTTQVNV